MVELHLYNQAMLNTEQITKMIYVMYETERVLVDWLIGQLFNWFY